MIRGRKLTAFVVAFAIVLAGIVMFDPVSAASKPGKVKNLTAIAISYNAVKLKWKKAKRAKTYHVYISTGGKYKYKKETRSTSCTIKKLKGNKNYRFKVRALRGKKKGKKSKAAYAKTYCKVTFVYKHENDWNDGCVETKKKAVGVKKGNDATAPKIPKKVDDGVNKYTFTRWNKSLKNIQGNTTIKAIYINDSNNQSGIENSTETEKELLGLINNYRVSKNLNKLTHHDGMSNVARQRAKEANDGYFDYGHHSTNSGDPGTALARAGLYATTSENLGSGSNAVEIFNKFKNSSGHNQNMLRSSDKYIGVGCDKDETGIMCILIFTNNVSTTPEYIIEYAYYTCSKCKKRQQIIQDYSTDYWTCPDCKTVNKKAW